MSVDNKNHQVVIRLFTATSESSQHTSVDVKVDSQYRVISGGALGFEHPGHVLTASCPLLDRDDAPVGWHAEAKDHAVVCPAKLTVYALGLYDPQGQWSVKCFSEKSKESQSPSVDVVVSDKWTMTGGGAWDKWSGPGNLLTGSFPVNLKMWRASGKDHLYPCPAKVVAYAIGVKHASGRRLETSLLEATSDQAQHPNCEIKCPDGKVILGGGGSCSWSGAGQLLWALRPSDDRLSGFVTSSKDHNIADPGRCTSKIIVCNSTF